MSVPDINRVNEVLRLDVETGVLYWRISLGSRAQAGMQAGYFHEASGYWFLKLDGVVYRQHVLIWFMLYGEWAPRLVDHKDRNRGNNRPSNLRKATESQQRQNKSMRNDNTSGHRGVYLHACGKYGAEVWVEGKKIWLGLHVSKESAAEASRIARIQHFGAFAPSYDQRG